MDTKLANFLKDKNISVYGLAKKIDMPQQQLHKIVSGATTPRVDTAQKIAAAIAEIVGAEVTLEDIFGDRTAPNGAPNAS